MKEQDHDDKSTSKLTKKDNATGASRGESEIDRVG